VPGFISSLKSSGALWSSGGFVSFVNLLTHLLFQLASVQCASLYAGLAGHERELNLAPTSTQLLPSFLGLKLGGWKLGHCFNSVLFFQNDLPARHFFRLKMFQ
jgi:hypothetical protein